MNIPVQAQMNDHNPMVQINVSQPPNCIPDKSQIDDELKKKQDLDQELLDLYNDLKGFLYGVYITNYFSDTDVNKFATSFANYSRDFFNQYIKEFILKVTKANYFNLFVQNNKQKIFSKQMLIEDINSLKKKM